MRALLQLLYLLSSVLLTSAGAVVLKSCRKGVWALTFDDGPDDLTPQVLKALDDAGVKATFFVLGESLEKPRNVEYLKRAYAAGHQIASHGYSHKSMSDLNEAEREKEMEDTNTRIAEAIGKLPNYMRPPYGDCNDACLATMEKLGYTVTHWNVDSQDWKHGNNPEQLVEDIKRYEDGQGSVAEPSDPQGVISLQHDIQPHSAKLVPQIIENIKSSKFKFATVAECGDGDRPTPYRNDVHSDSRSQKEHNHPDSKSSPSSDYPTKADSTNSRTVESGRECDGALCGLDRASRDDAKPGTVDNGSVKVVKNRGDATTPEAANDSAARRPGELAGWMVAALLILAELL